MGRGRGATLLIGMGVSAAGYGNVWHSVSVDRFGSAEKAAEDLGRNVSSLKSKYAAEEGKNKALKESGDKLVDNAADARAVARNL